MDLAILPPGVGITQQMSVVPAEMEQLLLPNLRSVDPVLSVCDLQEQLQSAAYSSSFICGDAVIQLMATRTDDGSKWMQKLTQNVVLHPKGSKAIQVPNLTVLVPKLGFPLGEVLARLMAILRFTLRNKLGESEAVVEEASRQLDRSLTDLQDLFEPTALSLLITSLTAIPG